MFVLDANIFIEAARRYYAFDIAPRFWSGLIKNAEKNKLSSIDKVFDELSKGNDDLSNWAKSDFKEFFEPTDIEQVLILYKEIFSSAQDNKQYNTAAKNDFAKAADGWLIAYAKYKEATIVTHEVFDKNRKNKIQIPNICEDFNINYINTFELLRELGIKF